MCLEKQKHSLLTPGPHGVRELVALLPLLVQNSCIIIIIIIITNLRTTTYYN